MVGDTVVRPGQSLGCTHPLSPFSTVPLGQKHPITQLRVHMRNSPRLSQVLGHAVPQLLKTLPSEHWGGGSDGPLWPTCVAYLSNLLTGILYSRNFCLMPNITAFADSV